MINDDLKAGSLNSRRNFIRKAVAGSLVAAGIPGIIGAAVAHPESKKLKPAKGNVILFQGDSITDAGRNRESESPNDPEALGFGYSLLAGAALLEKYPECGLRVYNKGVSGNKVYQLAERWEKDWRRWEKSDQMEVLSSHNLADRN